MEAAVFARARNDAAKPHTSEETRQVAMTSEQRLKRCRSVCAIAFTALYIAGLSSQWYITPDSSMYLLLGDSLAAGEGYSIFGQPHTKFPPGYPLLIAALKSIGLGSMIWLNLSMIVMGLACLWLTHRLLCKITTPGIALLATACLAASYEMYGASLRQLSDIPFMLLLLAGLLSYLRWAQSGAGHPELGTLALLLACCFRLNGIPVALCAALGLALQSSRLNLRRNLANGIGLTAGTAAIAVAIYLHHQQVQQTVATKSYSSELSKASARPIWQPLLNVYETGEELSILFTGQEMPHAVATLVFSLPILVGLLIFLRQRSFLVVLATAGYVGGILLLRPLLARYLLPIAPLLFMFYFVGLQAIIGRITEWSKVRPVVIGLAAVMVVMNVTKDVRLAHAVHQPEFQTYRSEWPALVEVAEFLRERSGPNDRFVGTNHDGVIAYLSDVACFQLDLNLAKDVERAEAAFHELPDHGVAHIVVQKNSESKLLRLLHDHTKSHPEYRIVLDNKRYAVYAIAESQTPAFVNATGHVISATP